uniref:Netrin 5 n=1 Tax=Oryzias melastigma TaxID=30732 RepID=A0A3B3BZP4_ORYME
MMFRPFSPSPSTLLVPILLRLFILILPSAPAWSSFSHTPLSWTSPHDPCYHPDGRPRHCLSEFINAAYGVPVDASHSLRVHDTDGNVTTLTDLHNPNNLTCWMAHAGHDTGDWVLTLPLGRRFEITYISLQFCNQEEPPDPISLSILKSMDYGRSWRPMQHYSSDCVVHFQQPAQTIAQTRHQETDALCSDPRPFQKQKGGAVLAFSALDGRPSSPDFDYSPTLQDWVTATDIRIVFHQISKNLKAGSFERPKEAPRNDGAGDARGTGSLTWRSDVQSHTGGQRGSMNIDNVLLFLDGKSKNTDVSEKKSSSQSRKGHRKGTAQDEDGYNVTSKEGEDLLIMDSLAVPKKGGKHASATATLTNAASAWRCSCSRAGRAEVFAKSVATTRQDATANTARTATPATTARRSAIARPANRVSAIPWVQWVDGATRRQVSVCAEME